MVRSSLPAESKTQTIGWDYEMQPAAPEISTCPTCGGPLEKTPDGGLGCISCLLRVGIGGEEEVTQDSTHEALEGDGHFGAYQIDRHEDGSLYELGRGAMGVTYRATDTTLKRKVALKIIKIDVAKRSVEARERFMREARAAAALRHENIATIHQFGIREETGQYFYAMELIEGETLEERVRRSGPLGASTAIDIARQVTAALAAAEKRGLVHRDLKPANLMLVSPDHETANTDRKDEKPIVKIIDFGLAKALNTETDPQSLTHDRFVGTPAFASPEQFEHSALDVRSDIYSLGETLWFALTGKTLFAGHSVEEIHRSQQSKALPIEQLKAAHVPHRLRSLLECMLAFEPSARPGTHDLAARLQHSSAQARGIRRTRITLAAAFMLILGLCAFLLFRSPRIQNLTSNLTPPEKSIAVLPFENMSSDPDNAYFANGIQEEILTRLTGIADLKVISRTSTLQYRSKPGNLAEIAKQLGVANILEGSVQKVSDQVRVNVQLVNAQTDSHLWADTYDRKLTDIFGVESEIAKRIAESLQAKLTGREEQALAVKPTNNPEAYDAYLRGLAFQARSYIRPSLEAAGFYERAVQLDSNFAVAWARLSRQDAGLYFDRVDATPARRDAAKRALENAQELESDSPETLLALGYYQYWVLRDYALSKITFDRVTKMLPGSSEVSHALGRVTRREGHWDQSIAYLERALALDPRNMELLTDAAWTYDMLRQFRAALKLYDRALDTTPNDADVMALKAGIYQAQGNLREAARFLREIKWQAPNEDTLRIKMTQLRLERNYDEAIRLLQARLAQFHFPSDYEKACDQVAIALMQRLAGDTAGAKISAEQARNTLEQLYRYHPSAATAANLSQAYAAMGEKGSALNAAERAIMFLPRNKDAVDGPGLEENLALIQMVFGETNRPIATLTQLLQTPYISCLYGPMPITPALLRLDPIWDPLRADPRFQELCQEKQPFFSASMQIPEKSIAVLPFENLSEEKANAYFAAGIQNEILTRLATVRDLKVISRTSTAKYQSKPDNLKTVAQELGVATILEGAVQKAGDKVRVNVQLIDARADTHLWAKSYDRDFNNILEVESEVSQEIADALRANLSPSESHVLASVQMPDAEAYDLFLRGEYELHQGESSLAVDAFDRADAFYRQALVRDPNFAEAAVAFARSRLYRHWEVSPLAPAELEEVKSLIDRALALAPNSPEAHFALGVFFYWARREYQMALTEFNRTLELQPNNALARGFCALVYRRRGEWERSLADFQRAQELDPRDAAIPKSIGGTYLALRLWKDSERAELRALAIDPHSAQAALLLLSSRLSETGDVNSARRILNDFPEAIKALTRGIGLGEDVVGIVGIRAYLDLMERRFTDAFQEFEKDVGSDDRAHLQQLAGRVALRVLAGQTEAGKSAGEEALPLLEARLRERPDDIFTMTELSWVYLALGRNADALRISKQTADLISIEKDALAGPGLQNALAQIEARAGAPEEAVKRLRRLLSIPAGGVVSIALLKIDPVWDPIRNRPDFQQLLSGPEQIGPNK
jgi:TolB-like protein/Tfp pilus assembly protein PilF/tRNA A-37 threonylcarbamoyl transferase component Bud32